MIYFDSYFQIKYLKPIFYGNQHHSVKYRVIVFHLVASFFFVTAEVSLANGKFKKKLLQATRFRKKIEVIVKKPGHWSFMGKTNAVDKLYY